jgi:hypothetical protein
MANPEQHGPSSVPADLATTLGELRASGYRSRSVKEELRNNLIRMLENDQQMFPGIVGFEETVVPQVQNAILSGQDIIFLGERGQAKTRLARTLPTLLDPWLPFVAGCEMVFSGSGNPVGAATIVSWQRRRPRHGRDPQAAGRSLAPAAVYPRLRTACVLLRHAPKVCRRGLWTRDVGPAAVIDAMLRLSRRPQSVEMRRSARAPAVPSVRVAGEPR